MKKKPAPKKSQRARGKMTKRGKRRVSAPRKCGNSRRPSRKKVIIAGGLDLAKVLKEARGGLRERLDAALQAALHGEIQEQANQPAEPTPEPVEDDLSDPTRSHKLARAFLAAFKECGVVRRAAAAAGIDRRTHTRWLKDLEGYAEAFAHASEEAADLLEEEARRRAMEGLRSYKFTKFGDPILHPVTGEPYFELVLSDPVLLRMLQAKRKEFAQRHEHSGPGGGPIPTETTHIYLPENHRDDPGQSGGGANA